MIIEHSRCSREIGKRIMTKDQLIKWGTIAAIVSAIVGVLMLLLMIFMEMELSIGVFIVVALVILSFTIIAMLILFSKKKKMPLITTAIQKIERYMDILRTFAAVIVAILVVLVFSIVLVFFTIKELPDAKKVNQTVRKVGNNIAKKNMASLSSDMDNIIHTIINYRKDPDATRNRVYEDALKQAANKGYVFYIPQKNYYIIPKNARDDKRLLTEKEREHIKNSFDDILKRSNERDQISLMNMVLSDIRVTEELWIPKERLVNLTPIDLTGVVGGYIGELVLGY